MRAGKILSPSQSSRPNYIVLLETLIAQKGWFSQPVGTPEDWAEQSWALGKAALVKNDSELGPRR